MRDTVEPKLGRAGGHGTGSLTRFLSRDYRGIPRLLGTQGSRVSPIAEYRHCHLLFLTSLSICCTNIRNGSELLQPRHPAGSFSFVRRERRQVNKIKSGCGESYEGNQRSTQTQHRALLGLRAQRAPRGRPAPQAGGVCQRPCQGRALQV